MADTTTKLNVSSRDAAGSRAARRLRRSGRVPGVLYGGGGEPVGFDADARELRLALASRGEEPLDNELICTMAGRGKECTADHT